MRNNKSLIHHWLVKYIIVFLAVIVSSFGYANRVEAGFLSDLLALPGVANSVLTGKVTDTKNTPVVGAAVQFLPDGIGSEVKCITDENGNYLLKVTAKSSGVIIITKENCRTQKKRIDHFYTIPGETVVINYAMQPDYISGKIINKNNYPMAETKISIEEDGGVSGIKTVCTDENGNYRCAIPEDGKYYWIAVSKDGYTIIRDRVWLSGGKSLNYTLTAL